MTGARLAASSRVAVVSSRAVEQNLSAIAAMIGHSPILVDLSADAFGHGLQRAASAVAASDVAVIAVSRIDDAIAMRHGGIDTEIVVWAPPVAGDLQAVQDMQLGVGVSSLAGARRALNAGSPSLWLQIGDRPGVATLPDSDLPSVFAELASHRPFTASVNLALVGGEPGSIDHALELAAGSGVAIGSIVVPLGLERPGLRSSGSQRALVRVGAEIFGLSESTGDAPAGTRPAMALRAPVIALKNVGPDVGVSYGYTYRTRNDTTLALIPLGYGDGIDRAAGNLARVKLGSVRYTIAGRVAMDASVLDIGDAAADVGDTVEFFGDPETGAPSAQEWGGLLGVPGAAITACLTARVERRWT